MRKDTIRAINTSRRSGTSITFASQLRLAGHPSGLRCLALRGRVSRRLNPQIAGSVNGLLWRPATRILRTRHNPIGRTAAPQRMFSGVLGAGIPVSGTRSMLHSNSYASMTGPKRPLTSYLCRTGVLSPLRRQPHCTS